MSPSPPLKVLHINTETGWRGGESQVHLLIKGQKQKGLIPLLACARGSKLFHAVSESNLCPVFPFSPLGALSFLGVSSILEQLRPENIDIIHTHTAHAVAMGALLSWRLKRACLFHSRRVDFRLTRFSKIKYLWRNAQILAISEGVRNVLIKSNIPETRITVVHSGIAVDLNPPLHSADDYRKEFHVPENAPVIGVVAALTDHKGIKYLLESFPSVLTKVSNAILVIVGEGELEFELHGSAKKLGIASNVRFTGFREDAQSIIYMFDIFVLPSHLEGLGTSLLDAMIREKPVIACRTGGIPEIVIEDKTGLLVPPRNPEALADAIINLLDNPEFRKKMGVEGKKRVIQHFSADSMVSATIAAYHQALNKRLNH